MCDYAEFVVLYKFLINLCGYPVTLAVCGLHGISFCFAGPLLKSKSTTQATRDLSSSNRGILLNKVALMISNPA